MVRRDPAKRIWCRFETNPNGGTLKMVEWSTEPLEGGILYETSSLREDAEMKINGFDFDEARAEALRWLAAMHNHWREDADPFPWFRCMEREQALMDVAAHGHADWESAPFSYGSVRKFRITEAGLEARALDPKPAPSPFNRKKASA